MALAEGCVYCTIPSAAPPVLLGLVSVAQLQETNLRLSLQTAARPKTKQKH